MLIIKNLMSQLLRAFSKLILNMVSAELLLGKTHNACQVMLAMLTILVLGTSITGTKVDLPEKQFLINNNYIYEPIYSFLHGTFVSVKFDKCAIV